MTQHAEYTSQDCGCTACLRDPDPAPDRDVCTVTDFSEIWRLGVEGAEPSTDLDDVEVVRQDVRRHVIEVPETVERRVGALRWSQTTVRTVTVWRALIR